MQIWDRYVPLVGRILVTALFLLSGYMKLTQWSGMAAYMASQRLPAPSLLLAGAAFIEVVGGVCIVIGYRTRIAAIVQFLYLIPVTLVFHRFWSAPPAQQAAFMIHFWKNIGIMGGLLLLAANGPGKLSVDAKLLKTV
jgi:putative oxidoreductase